MFYKKQNMENYQKNKRDSLEKEKKGENLINSNYYKSHKKLSEQKDGLSR